MQTIFVEFVVAEVCELNGGECRVLNAGVASLVRDEHVGPHVGLLWRLKQVYIKYLLLYLMPVD